MTFGEILKEATDNRPFVRIEEAGLSRILRLTERPFAMITAFREGKSLKQNRANNMKLLQMLNRLGMGPHMTNGSWLEAPADVDYEKAKAAGKLVRAEEESFFVPMPKDMKFADFKSKILELINIGAWKQDAALIGDGEAVYNMYRTGKMEKIGNKVGMNNIGDFYSTYRKRPQTKFVFEGLSEPDGFASRLLFQLIGLKHLT